MKYLITSLAIFIFSANPGYSQNWDEWFRQKKTQRKYLIQQIAALQVYIEKLQKGYEIVKGGLTAIGDIKNGEFNLHKGYFASLKTVSPKIRSYARIADIIALQRKILQIYHLSYKQAQKSNAFNADELQYIYRVYGRLLDDCTNTLDQLVIVTTSAKLEMQDGERMARIDSLYLDIQDQYTFIKSFSNQTMILATARLKEKKEAEVSRKLLGIKN